MLIAQDPLRDNRWYSDVDEFPKGKIGSREDYVCTEALVSSPFGLHDRSWRENKRGGGRMKLLVEALIGYGYGIYLTDCRKYFVYDHKESAKYSKDKKDLYRIILQKEIDIIKPVRIVAMGNQAYAYCQDLLGDDPKLIYVPHFSGAATWRAKKEFFKGENRKVSIEELAGAYVKRISEFCQTLKIQLIAADQMYRPYHFQTYHPPKSNQCQLQRVIRGGALSHAKCLYF